jgi:sec-independent protein translocase protein TatA
MLKFIRFSCSSIYDNITLQRRINMFGLGLPEMIVVLVIGLVFFGPSKLPDLGKSLGEAIRGFKKGIAAEPEEVKAKIEK